MSNVYIIGDAQEKKIKIGISVDIERRLAQLQTGSQIRLLLFCCLECSDTETAKRLESLLHERYAKQRDNGEWFNVSYGQFVSDLESMLNIAECITGVRITRSRMTAPMRTKGIARISERSRLHKSNAQGLVYAYLDSHPTDATLPSRTLAERIGVGHDSANKYRNEWLARVQVSIE